VESVLSFRTTLRVLLAAVRSDTVHAAAAALRALPYPMLAAGLVAEVARRCLSILI
jgi:hypothetical protein